MNTYTLLIHCKDQPGLIARISEIIFSLEGNILKLEQHVDAHDHQFFFRVTSEHSEVIDLNTYEKTFSNYLKSISANVAFFDQNKKKKTAVFVSKYLHCLEDLLLKQRYQNAPIDIDCIISNHLDAQAIAEHAQIPSFI